jgi:hypothetical protein
MSTEKQEPEAEVITSASPDITHIPIVAEGTGKTAEFEGAKAKIVYNVRTSVLLCLQNLLISNCAPLG